MKRNECDSHYVYLMVIIMDWLHLRCPVLRLHTDFGEGCQVFCWLFCWNCMASQFIWYLATLVRQSGRFHTDSEGYFHSVANPLGICHRGYKIPKVPSKFVSWWTASCKSLSLMCFCGVFDSNIKPNFNSLLKFINWGMPWWKNISIKQTFY